MIKKVWGAAITSAAYSSLLTRSSSETDTVRLLVASAPHSGDWFQAPPITEEPVGCTQNRKNLMERLVFLDHAAFHNLGCNSSEHVCNVTPAHS